MDSRFKDGIEEIDRFLSEVPEVRGAKNPHGFLRTIRYSLEDEVFPSEKQIEIVRDIYRKAGRKVPKVFQGSGGLRAAMIRLAHERPELREDLLPLLREASEDDLVQKV